MTGPIATDRLVLRAPALTDAPRIADLSSDPGVARMLTRVPCPNPVEEVEAFLRAAAPNPWVRAIEADGALVGLVSIEDHLGYWLGRPFWGRGYATEAAGALLSAWFAAGGGPVVSGAFAENAASRRVLAKLGFVTTGLSRRFCRARGGEVEHVDMALDPAGWAALRSAAATPPLPRR